VRSSPPEVPKSIFSKMCGEKHTWPTSSFFFFLRLPRPFSMGGAVDHYQPNDSGRESLLSILYLIPPSWC